MDVREKLVELLNEIQDSGIIETPAGFGFARNYIENERIASHLISHGVTVQEWISVKDRYPDEAGFYICFFEARPGHWRVSTLHWNGTNWNNIGGYIPTSVRTTHWMPLPQPPKGE